jgi:RHS repeat-associated protein
MFFRRLRRRLLTACFSRQPASGRADALSSRRRPRLEPLEDVCPPDVLSPLVLSVGAAAAATAAAAVVRTADLIAPVWQPVAGVPGEAVPPLVPGSLDKPATAADDPAPAHPGDLGRPESATPPATPAEPLEWEVSLSSHEGGGAVSPGGGGGPGPNAPVAAGGAAEGPAPTGLALSGGGSSGQATGAVPAPTLPPTLPPLPTPSPAVARPAAPSAGAVAAAVPPSAVPLAAPGTAAPPVAVGGRDRAALDRPLAAPGTAAPPVAAVLPAAGIVNAVAPDPGDPGLMGLSQASLPPDIASGGVTHMSYTQLGNNANPFHYDAIPSSLLLGDGRRFTLSNPSVGGTRSTQLNMFLYNDGAFKTGAASGTDFSITGKVTVDGMLYDGTLVTGRVRGFGWQVSSGQAEFEVRIGITGGELTKPTKNADPTKNVAQNGLLKVNGELALLLHQPGLPVSSFPKPFNVTTTLGTSDARKMAEVLTNTNPVNPGCGCNQSDQPPGGINGAPADNAGNSVYMNTGESTTGMSSLGNQGRGLSLQFTDGYRSGIRASGPMGHNWGFNYDLHLIQVNAENLKEIRVSFPSAKVGDVVRDDTGDDRADIYTLNPDGITYTDPHGFFTYLVILPDGSFSERDQAGTVTTYAKPDKMGRASLTSQTDRDGNKLTFSYNAQGLLSTATDPLGRTFTFTYDPGGTGLLTGVTDYAGRTESFSYDALGEMVSETTPPVTGTPTGNDFPSGKTTRYTYSEFYSSEALNHEITSITAPNEVADGGPARTVYAYDTNPSSPNAGRVTGVTWGGTNYSGVPSGGTIQYSYQSLISSPVFDVTTHVSRTTVTNRDGDVSKYEYNKLGNILEYDKLNNRGVRPGDPSQFTTTYQYDFDYHLLQVTMPQGNTTQYTYDTGNPDRFQQGNLLQVTQTPDAARGGDQSAITTTFTYEPIYNQVHTMTEPRGNDPTYVPQNGGAQSAARYTATYTYDYQEGTNFAALDAILGAPAGAAASRLAAAGIPMGLGDVNGDGRTDQTAGNLIREQDPTVHLLAGSNEAAVEGTTSQPIVTTYTYNDFGQMTSTTDPEANVTRYDYYSPATPGSGAIAPAGGGYLAQTRQDTDSNPIRDSNTNPAPTNITHQYQYDTVGNRTRAIDGRGIETDYVFNQLNQVVETVRAAAVPGSPTSSEPLPLVAFQYLSRTFYDYNDNVVIRQVEDRGNTANVDGNPPAADLPAFVPGATNPDPAGGAAFQDTVYKYDILDRRVEKVDEASNGASPEFLHTRSRYDPNGNAVLTIEPEGNATATYYDERDLVYQRTTGATGPAPLTLLAPGDPTSYDTRGGLPATVTNSYDPNGNLVESVAADDTDGSPSNNSKRPSGTSTGGNGATTLNDAHQAWMPNQWQGRTVLIVSGTGAGQGRVIASNTATALTVATAWTTTPDATSVYAFQGDRTRYQYDGFDRRVATVDGVGNETVTQYDPDGDVIRTSTFGPTGGPSPTADGPDLLSGPVSSLGVIQSGNLVNSNLLRSTEYSYDELNRSFQTSRVLFVNTIPTTRTPDVAEGGSDVGLGSLTPGQAAPVPGVSGVTIFGRVSDRTEYDRDSRITFTVEDDLNTRRAFYDGAGRVLETVDPAGNTVETAYDGDSNVLETRETDVSQVPGVANEVFLTTNFYDSLNRLQETVDNLGQTTYDRYDSRDNLVATADADGPAGPAITRRAFSGGALTVNTTNTFGNVTRYFYDGLDRRVRSEQVLTAAGQGDGTHVGASVYGVKDDGSAPESFTPTPDPTQGGGDGRIRTGMTYDKNSLPSALIDDQGNVTVYLYDDLDRQVAQTGGLTVNSTTLDSADVLGPRTVVTPTNETINNPASIPNSEIDTQLTEAKSRLTAVAGLFPPLANRVDDRPPTTGIYGYDADGNVLIRSDENNSYAYTKYDAIDRPIAVRVFRAGQSDSFAGDPIFAPSPASLPTHHSLDDEPTFQPVDGTTIQNFQYDGLSRVTYAFDNNDPTTAADDSTVTNAYDSLNRIIEETQMLGSQPTQAIDSAWRADALRSKLTYPNGRAEVYTYDHLDRLATVKDQGAAQDIADYKYIGVDRVLERDYPINGTRETYLDNAGTTDVGYDGLRRPVEMRDLRGDDSLIVGFTYTYDRVGNKLTEGKLHDPNNSETYTYDSAYRLVTFHRAAGGITPSQTSWTLDGVGNWDAVSGGAGAETRQYSSDNEIISRTSGSTTTNVVSDDNGNETDDGTYVYTYDALNRLRTATRKSDGMMVAAYAYDAEGRRIDKVVTNSGALDGTTYYDLDGQREIEEHDGAGALAQQYVYGMYVDEPLVVDGNLSGMTPTRLFYFQNALYSVYALTDTTGAIVEGYQYDAYGRQTVFTAPGLVGVSNFASLTNVSQGGSSQFANPFLFTGRRLDAETSLYYYRARILDPTEGRFLSRDPVPGVNLYEYVRDNPLRFLDWTGKDDPGCDLPAWAMTGLNVGNCELRCCAQHDACFYRHHCTAATWSFNALKYGGRLFGPFGGFCGGLAALHQCTKCNDNVMACFARCKTGIAPPTGPRWFCPNGPSAGTWYDNYAAIPASCWKSGPKPPAPVLPPVPPAIIPPAVTPLPLPPPPLPGGRVWPWDPRAQWWFGLKNPFAP